MKNDPKKFARAEGGGMTFEEANKAIETGNEDYDTAWDAFGLGFRGSICDFCVHYKDCHASYCDDEQGCIIDECNFYKEG